MPSTALEQYLLELINDARLDPMGDAARYISSYAPLTSSRANIQQALSYFGVNGGQLLAAYQALAPAQPLAFNDALASAARAHDQAMISAGQQSHQLPGEADFGARLRNAGYSYRSAGENIYAYAQDMLFAQAGFMVDWGGSAATGGMQSPPGHRDNIMGAAFREVGVGVAPASGGAVGPLVVTEDFGTRGTDGAFLLGAAYADADRDGFYSVGEGVAGLSVSVGGVISATSAESGGWTLPASLTGTQAVQLSGAGLAGTVTVRTALTDASGAGVNVKLDVVDGSVLRLSASAAVVTGAVSTVQALGVQGLALTLGDGAGRTLLGNAGGDTLTGGSGDDFVRGGAGNDVIDGGPGNDRLDGGAGRDVAAYGVASTSAAWTRSGSSYAVSATGLGADTLTGIEVLRFTDRDVALAPVRDDVNGDGRGDIVWQNRSGVPSVWAMQGSDGGSDTASVGAYLNYENPGPSWRLVGTADLSGDGQADLLWQNADGTPSAWLSGRDGGSVAGYLTFGNPGSSWRLVGGADLDGDGRADLLWRNVGTGAVSAWMMGPDGANVTSYVDFGTPAYTWDLIGAGDLNGDGRADLVFQAGGGSVAAWLMGGSLGAPSVATYGSAIDPGSGWSLIGTGDLNGDGRDDLLFQHSTGLPSAWLMGQDGTSVMDNPVFGNPGRNWHLMGATDANGDGRSDLEWQDNSGLPSLWIMGAGGTSVVGTPVFGNPGVDWRIV